MEKIILDGREMTCKRRLHIYLEDKLGFPDYYGKNADALYDCLVEFCKDKSIEIINTDRMLKNLGDYGFIILNVFEDAISENLQFVHD